MAYSATVISVMIASPGDVTEERNLIRDVIHEWNDLNSANTRCVLLPIGWESHSFPVLGGRAQEIINEQVLDKCDLLVAVFWTRLGTPTGDFDSGSVEEIQRHVDSGKPAMVYFSTAPVAPQSLDTKQYDALGKFREWCIGEGLVETYDNIAAFRDKFRRHLAMTVRDNSHLAALQSNSAGDMPPPSNAVSNLAPIFTLSDEARRLLAEASKDRNGTIVNARYIGGQAIQTNGINFTDSSDRRSVARWEAALNQLLEYNFVVARGVKGEIFEVTDAGYSFAENFVANASKL